MGDRRRTNPRTGLAPASCARRAASPGPADLGLLGRGRWRDSGPGGVGITVTAPNAGSVDRRLVSTDTGHPQTHGGRQSGYAGCCRSGHRCDGTQRRGTRPLPGAHRREARPPSSATAATSAASSAMTSCSITRRIPASPRCASGWRSPAGARVRRCAPRRADPIFFSVLRRRGREVAGDATSQPPAAGYTTAAMNPRPSPPPPRPSPPHPSRLRSSPTRTPRLRRIRTAP